MVTEVQPQAEPRAESGDPEWGHQRCLRCLKYVAIAVMGWDVGCCQTEATSQELTVGDRVLEQSGATGAGGSEGSNVAAKEYR